MYLALVSKEMREYQPDSIDTLSDPVGKHLPKMSRLLHAMGEFAASVASTAVLSYQTFYGTFALKSGPVIAVLITRLPDTAVADTPAR
jgi:hypothetical protein